MTTRADFAAWNSECPRCRRRRWIDLTRHAHDELCRHCELTANIAYTVLAQQAHQGGCVADDCWCAPEQNPQCSARLAQSTPPDGSQHTR